ncbi:hypothetical protein XBKB1_800027 [Xenorhabdus bovienii str. kraussei Becker Underwood]|uniref:Uncharacterized protein n=1 Tax=Xenorhabdus bovienii str. kraussei Becker Underwood TaxID=1398204 RepID=A0A077Q132_XENBV|nr:hypothetical protein XBKB1_800027 [Xenorhabdus bovienii str. kraussei Becker Underwood]
MKLTGVKEGDNTGYCVMGRESRWKQSFLLKPVKMRFPEIFKSSHPSAPAMTAHIVRNSTSNKG